MKKIFFTSVVLLTLNNLHAQISDVQQKGDYVYLYGANNKQIASKRLMSGELLAGMSSTFFVTQKGDYVYIYDDNAKQIASKRLMSGEIVKSVSGNSFNTKKDGYVYTYDKSGKQISSRRE
jgi:hypothetical protein